MWRILKKGKNVFYPKDADYYFEKVNDLLKVLPYLNPKLQEGDWIVVCLGFSFKDLITIEEEADVPDYVLLQVYTTQDVIDRFYGKYPKYRTLELDKTQVYQELLANCKLDFTDRISKELFRRCHGNLDKIQETIRKLEELKEEDTDKAISTKELNTVVMKEDVVYAKDVLYSYLLHDCELIPKKGHPLAGYRWKKPKELLSKLIDNLGDRYAYNVLRKYISNLVDEKIAYMHNEAYKEPIVEYIDIFQVSELYASFNIYGYKSLYVLMENIEWRKKNASIFKEKIITYDS